jgi:hypothetical protein
MTDLRSGVVYDNVDTDLTQDDNDGTITFCGECEGELFTLTPLSAPQGATIPYELSYFGEGSPCDASVSGTMLLNTITNTIRGQGKGTTDDCSSVFVSLTLTRN